MSATALLRENSAPSEDEIRKAHPGEHLPLHRLREHRRGDQGGRGMTETTVTPERRSSSRKGESKAGFIGTEHPAQGGQAARPGRGRLLRRRQAARDGLRPLRPLAVRARDASSRSTSRRRSSSTASTGRSRATRSRSSPTRSSSSRHRPARTSRTTRSRSAACATSAIRSPPSSRARASWRATRPSSSRSSTSRCRVRPRRARSRSRTRSILHEDAGSNTGLVGRLRLGRLRRCARGRRPRRPHRTAALRPLLVDAARMLRLLSSSSTAAPASGRSTATTRCRAWARSGWRPRCASASTSCASSARTSAAASATRSRLHPQYTACCLLARKLNRPVQWTEWRTDQHTANTHGNERTFLDVDGPREG